MLYSYIIECVWKEIKGLNIIGRASDASNILSFSDNKQINVCVCVCDCGHKTKNCIQVLGCKNSVDF